MLDSGWQRSIAENDMVGNALLPSKYYPLVFSSCNLQHNYKHKPFLNHPVLKQYIVKNWLMQLGLRVFSIIYFYNGFDNWPNVVKILAEIIWNKTNLNAIQIIQQLSDSLSIGAKRC